MMVIRRIPLGLGHQIEMGQRNAQAFEKHTIQFGTGGI